MKTIYITAIAMAAMLAACDSPLETTPTTAIPSDEALTTARGIELAVTGAYSTLQDGSLYGRELTVYPELYADNLRFTGTFGTDGEVGNRNVTADNGAILGVWEVLYDGINEVNNVLAAIPEVSDLSAAEADQLRGEALFLRGLHYFNLVRYFGGVPIVTEPSSGVSEESNVARSSLDEVYTLIESDLEEAANLLEPSSASGRATQGAANALLARVYLEQGEWAAARDKATQVIESGEYELVENYADLFETENSSGSIFELQFSINDSNSQAFWYFPPDLGGRQGYTPTDELYAAFESGDERLDFSIGVLDDGTLYGSKYFRVASGDDNVIVLRLSEMYLIRAEANARLGADPAVVRADINVIRNRAGLPDLPTTVDTEEELITAILEQRRLEFAFEGYRFFDLRRTGRAMEVLDISANQLLWPIPQAERDVNSNLEQNPGY